MKSCKNTNMKTNMNKHTETPGTSQVKHPEFFKCTRTTVVPGISDRAPGDVAKQRGPPQRGVAKNTGNLLEIYPEKEMVGSIFFPNEPRPNSDIVGRDQVHSTRGEDLGAKYFPKYLWA